MEIQQLKGFYYSTKLGSLTRAAEKLSVTQSAVSQQIKSLESELGIQLFNRFGPKKELTPDGKLFFELISPIIQELDSLKSTFEDMKGNEKGLLTIAATTFMIMNLLPPVIKQYTEKYPNVQLEIMERRWNEIVRLAHVGEIDFGLTPVTKISSNLNFLLLEPIDRVLITSIGHPLSRKTHVTLEDIVKYPMITYERGLVTRGEFDRVMREHGLQSNIIMEATNAETIKRYVEMGIGISIIPKMALFPTKTTRLEVISINRYFGKSQYGVLLRKGKHITRWSRHFLELLIPDLTERLK
ncbi:MAG TPA: LysR family transcriptional regulator [bacterium]|nr:LysR family transcriptional regulator [bacterium]